VLRGLGEVYAGERRWAVAEPLYRRALAIDEKALAPANPELRKLREDLARLLQATGQMAAAGRTQ
jgi:hypothetical protein